MQADIRSELRDLKNEITMLKARQEYLEDALLSAKDAKALREARNDLKKRKIVKLSELKRH